MQRLCPCLILGLFASAGLAQDPPILVMEKGAHSNNIAEVLFLLDGKRLVSVSEDKTIRFWDVATGGQIKVLRPPIGPGEDGKLLAAALSPDGKLLAVGGVGVRKDGKRTNPTYLIDLTRDEIVQVLAGGEAPVHALAFSRDGRRLAVAALQDGAIQVWDLPARRLEITLKMEKNQLPRHLTFSPEGKYLAVTTLTGGLLHMFHLASGKAGITLEELGGVNQLTWAPDGKSFATASTSGVHLWDAKGTLQKHLMFERRCFSVSYTPDSAKLLVESLRAEGGYNLAFWVDPLTEKDFPVSQDTCTSLALSPDGALVAGLTGNGTSGAALVVRQGTTGAEVCKIAMGGARASAYEITWRDAQTVQMGRSWSFNFARLEAEAGVDAPEARGAIRNLADLELKPISVTQFDIVKGAALHAHIKSPGGMFRGRTFLTPDLVVAGTLRGDLHLFAAADGRHLRSCPAHSTPVDAVAPSPGGKLVASYSQIERTVCLWDTERALPTLHLCVVPTLNKKDVTRNWLAWAPDGYYACSKGAEAWVGWHVAKGPDRLAEFAPVERFREKYHQPDVIRRLLASRER